MYIYIIMINIQNPKHKILCRNWFRTVNLVLLNSVLSLNVCVLAESSCYMSWKDWLPAPCQPHWGSFRKHNGWNSWANSHLSLPMGGAMLLNVINFIGLCWDCPPRVKLEEIDVKWNHFIFCLLTQRDLLWLFLEPRADYWLWASQLKLNIMLWLCSYQ